MAHKLGGAIGQAADEGGERGGIELARQPEARKMIGGAAAAILQRLEQAGEQRTADPGNAELLRDPADGVEHLGQDMRMLVRIEMRRRNSSGENLTHLLGEPVV